MQGEFLIDVVQSDDGIEDVRISVLLRLSTSLSDENFVICVHFTYFIIFINFVFVYGPKVVMQSHAGTRWRVLGESDLAMAKPVEGVCVTIVTKIAVCCVQEDPFVCQ